MNWRLIFTSYSPVPGDPSYPSFTAGNNQVVMTTRSHAGADQIQHNRRVCI
jgi:hypothetical protein